jgi:hypothetical protein
MDWKVPGAPAAVLRAAGAINLDFEVADFLA